MCGVILYCDIYPPWSCICWVTSKFCKQDECWDTSIVIMSHQLSSLFTTWLPSTCSQRFEKLSLGRISHPGLNVSSGEEYASALIFKIVNMPLNALGEKLFQWLKIFDWENILTPRCCRHVLWVAHLEWEPANQNSPLYTNCSYPESQEKWENKIGTSHINPTKPCSGQELLLKVNVHISIKLHQGPYKNCQELVFILFAVLMSIEKAKIMLDIRITLLSTQCVFFVGYCLTGCCMLYWRNNSLIVRISYSIPMFKMDNQSLPGLICKSRRH